MRSVHHSPVMVGEVLSALDVRAGGSYIDATVGEGGHAQAILGGVQPPPRLLGIDLDVEALATSMERLSPYKGLAEVIKGSYVDLGRLASGNGFMSVDGVLFDLGLSSLQLGMKDRGFSFLSEGNLDMRFDQGQLFSAEELVNQTRESELADLIFKYGEEPRSRRFARAIVSARPVTNTLELASIIMKSAGGRGPKGLHPATRTFQALRIAVNEELINIKEGLQQALEVLMTGGKMVVISYHSLEDRIVKRFFKEASRSCICPVELVECLCDHKPSIRLITRKVVTPSTEEIGINSRSRSARLRVAEIL